MCWFLGRQNTTSPWSKATLATCHTAARRCLRQAIRDAQLSISPDAPRVSLVCQESVRAFFIARAADVRRDPPLVAACAPDMLKLCGNATDGPGQVRGGWDMERAVWVRPAC